MSAKPSVCLAMICKNEAHVIRRCLDSVVPFIDSWCISDTGSDDDTIGVILRWAEDTKIPGSVIRRPWRDFSNNRNEVLRRAWAEAEYALVIDADDELVGNRIGWGTQIGLTADVGYLEVQHDGVSYWRAHFMKRGSGAYEGVLHEVFARREDTTHEFLDLPKYLFLSGGDRSKDPERYQKDIATLRAALETETNERLRSRYQFYLGQALTGVGDHLGAIEAYTKRVAMGPTTGTEELWWSLYMIAECMAAHDEEGANQASTIDAYLWAYDFNPKRVEPLRSLEKFLRCSGRDRAADAVRLAGDAVPCPERGLFLNRSEYGPKGDGR